MNITELKTKDGRTFRVTTENKSQVQRLNKIISENKNTFISIDSNICNGIHTIKEFEKFKDTFK